MNQNKFSFKKTKIKVNRFYNFEYQQNRTIKVSKISIFDSLA
jgi:hypothetical protein